MEQISERCQNDGTDTEQAKGIAEYFARLFRIARTARHGKQRNTAVTEKRGKRHYQRYYGEGKPHTRKRKSVRILQMTEIDAVHYVIKQMHELCNGQRYRLIDDTAPYRSVAEIICFCRYQ